MIWQIHGGAFATTRSLPDAVGSCDVAGVHDRDGDGELVYRHQTTGQVVTWTIENAALVHTTNFGVVGSDWQIRGTIQFA